MDSRNLTGHPSFLYRDTLAGEEFFLKTIGHSRLVMFMLCALAAASARAEPTTPATAPTPTHTWSSSSSWRFGLGAGGSWSPSHAEGEAPLSAAGFDIDACFELTRGNWIPFHGGIGLFSVGPTEWDDSLFRFRAFQGSRFGIETGYRFPVGRSELAILAGGGWSASRFTSLSVATAYLSVLGEARFLTPVAIRGLPGMMLGVSIPVEYMWRGTARTFSAGLEMNAAIPLGRKQKP